MLLAGNAAGTAYAAPAGPVVSAGRAGYDPASLTVTSAAAHTHISWQSFNVSAGELVKFVQPNAQSTVLNLLSHPQSLSVLGGLQSNGSVLFLSNGQVFGSGLHLDLARTLDSSLRMPQMALGPGSSAPLAQPLTTLAEGSIYVIGQDEQALTGANGDVVLNPGKSVELAHVATPSLRVGLTAPVGEAINLSRLVGAKRETGIFAGLFRAPEAARRAAQPDAGTTWSASAQAHGLEPPEVERFYRYALAYAQMRRAALLQEGGMMPVAAAPTGRMMLAAAKSRPSLLPRDIEIGAVRLREPALPPSPAAEAEPIAGPQTQAAAVAAQENSVPVLAYVSVEPPAEMIATRVPPPPMPAAGSPAPADSMPVLAYVAAEPPAAMLATRLPSPIALVAANAAPADGVPVLAYVSAEPPAAMVATRTPQPVALAAAGAAQADSTPALVMAAAEPPPLAQVQPAAPKAAAVQVLPAARPAAGVIVVAQAQTGKVSEPQEDSGAKELRVERRAPRYFTDYRGALFFM